MASSRPTFSAEELQIRSILDQLVTPSPDRLKQLQARLRTAIEAQEREHATAVDGFANFRIAVAAAERPETAFDTLVDAIKPFVSRVLQNSGHDEGFVEEAFSQALVTLWERLALWRRQAKWPADDDAVKQFSRTAMTALKRIARNNAVQPISGSKSPTAEELSSQVAEVGRASTVDATQPLSESAAVRDVDAERPYVLSIQAVRDSSLASTK